MTLLEYVRILATITLNFLLLSSASHVSIPLKHHRNHGQDLYHKLRAISRRASNLQKRGLSLDALDFGSHDWWYGNFDVGDSKNLSLSIDTASTTLYLNSGLYKPSNESIDFNQTINSGFGTWFANGCGNGNFEANKYKDTVSVSGSPTLAVRNQTFGTLLRNEPEFALPPFTRDGIMGMSVGLDFPNSGASWIVNLCNEEIDLKDCGFGMALGTSGTGSFVFGGVDDSLYEGDLTPVGKQHSNNTYPWNAHVVINGTKVLIANRSIGLFDSGTANILVSPDDARTIFDALGVQTMVEPAGWGNCSAPGMVVGYYPCDKPPTVGLQLQLSGGNDGPVFNIEPSAFQLADNGNNNCTAIIIGHPSKGGEDAITVGNAWMIGKYTDYTAWGVLKGVAELKDKGAPLSASSSSSSSKNAASDLQPFLPTSVLGLVTILNFLL